MKLLTLRDSNGVMYAKLNSEFVFNHLLPDSKGEFSIKNFKKGGRTNIYVFKGDSKFQASNFGEIFLFDGAYIELGPA